jgi:hypothetical protein
MQKNRQYLSAIVAIGASETTGITRIVGLQKSCKTVTLRANCFKSDGTVGTAKLNIHPTSNSQMFAGNGMHVGLFTPENDFELSEEFKAKQDVDVSAERIGATGDAIEIHVLISAEVL